LIRRTDIEQREKEMLAPYAALSGESQGRAFPQEEHPLRTVFQRDRDRIVHSAAFRRMEYKTQVFLPHEGDHFRTRLTHTIEVAQVGRTLARNLGLNEDLVEAIALVHDVGHTPFGHSGEDVLNELLVDCGGFNHNRQSLRVVDFLEQRYPEHPGLNLTFEVREGIVKHETKVPIKHAGFDNTQRATLEASLVDLADEIAYNAHDVDDGLASGLIAFEDIKSLSIWETFSQAGFHGLTEGSAKNDQMRYQVVRWLLNRTATDVVDETSSRIKELGIVDLESVRSSSGWVCGYSEEIRRQVTELKSFLHDRLYCHPYLVEKADRAKEVVSALFHRFMKEPTLMPERFQEMLLTESKETVIADYIAGMTDRYAMKLHQQ